MVCFKFEYSNHAVVQMFKRSISADEVEAAIEYGDTIKDYPQDTPFPSQLKLYFVRGVRPIHVVVSQDVATGTCFVITAYQPDTMIWQPDFRNKL